MIKAEHKKWARKVFNPYITRLMKKYFAHYYMVNKFPEIDKNHSLIVTPNHISWWDGFFIDHVSRFYIARKLHIMMLESTLEQYRFFRKLGAYSINPESKTSVLESMRYTKEILKDNKNFVVTYPQGEIEQFEKRPLSFKEGIKLFFNDDVIIIPVGFKIEYYNEKLPSIICRFGEPLNFSQPGNNIETFKKYFEDNLKKLSASAADKNFKTDLLTG